MAVFQKRRAGGESHTRKVVLVTLALIYSLMSSGVVFGFSGIYGVLVYKVQAFGGLCPPDTPLTALPCEAQASALSLMYTIGATTISGCAFFVGLLLDYAGPRVTVCLGSFLLTCGLTCVAFAQEWGDFLYYLGFFIMAVGGPCVLNSTYSFGELFPSHSSAIIGAISTGFNSSTLILTVFSWVITTFDVPFKSLFLAYTLVPATVFLTSLFLFPDEPFGGSVDLVDSQSHLPSEGIRSLDKPRFQGELLRVWALRLAEDRHADVAADGSMSQPLIGAGDVENTHLKQEASGKLHGTVPPQPPDVYNSKFTTQISSPVFWSMAVVTAFVVLRVNYYIQTLYRQLLFSASLTHPGDPVAAIAEADFYSALFNYMLPPGGICMIPIVGYVMVRLGFAPTFLCIAALNTAFCFVNCLQMLPPVVQVISFVLYAMVRPFVFGGMAAYLGQIFGFANFGKLYGLVRVTGAIAVAFEFLLEQITINYFGGDYLYVNLGFLGCGLALFVFPVYLWKHVFYGYFLRP